MTEQVAALSRGVEANVENAFSYHESVKESD